MSAGEGLEPRLCRCGCGRPLPEATVVGGLPARHGLPAMLNRAQPAEYASDACRRRSEKAYRDRKRAAAPVRAPLAARPCAWVECSRPFTPHPKRTTTLFCSKRCGNRHAASRVDVSPVRRDWATGEAARRAASERCPACAAALGADGPLLFCADRCGWDLLLTARQRDPRADAVEPTPDPDADPEETMATPEHDPDDADDDQAEPEEPAELSPAEGPEPASEVLARASDRLLAFLADGPQRQAVLRGYLAVSSGTLHRSLRGLLAEGLIVRREDPRRRVSYALPGTVVASPPASRLDGLRVDATASLEPVLAELAARGPCAAAALEPVLQLSRASIICRLAILTRDGRVVAEGRGTRRVYRLAGQAPPAPRALRLVPLAPASPLAALLAQVATLPPADLDTLLAALAPVAAARQAYLAALAGLRSA